MHYAGGALTFGTIRAVASEAVAGGGGVTADFHSEWDSTGYLDSGKWANVDVQDASYLQVQTSTSSPSGRCLHIEGTVSNDFLNVVGIASPPAVPSIGGYVQVRFFHRVLSGDGDGEYHPCAFGNAVGNPPGNGFTWSWLESSTAAFQMKNDGTGSTESWGTDTLPNLRNWHMHVVRFQRSATNSWNLVGYRCYAYPGYTLAFDETNIRSNFGSGSAITGATFTISSTQMVRWCGFGNGVTTLVGSPHQQDEWDAVAMEVGSTVSDMASVTYGFYTQEGG